MRTGAVLACLTVVLSGGVCGAQELPRPSALPLAQPPVATLSPPRIVEPAALLAPSQPYMDPRTHAWQQRLSAPADQCSMSGFCQGGVGCLGDRQPRCWLGKVCDSYQVMRQRCTAFWRGLRTPTVHDVPEQGCNAPHPE
jgi:hypothetical protein